MRALTVLIVAAICFISCKKELDADLVLINGMVYNGLDTIGRKQMVAVKEDRIIYIGDFVPVSKETNKIDAKGLIISPGFIDPHTHADRELIKAETAHNLPYVMQGVTTVVAGNDGDSFFPLKDQIPIYEKHGLGTNAVFLTGHGTLRRQVIGKSDRAPTREELKRMEDLMTDEMNSGSFGLSTGLFYAPGSFSETDEVIALARVAQTQGGIYDTHLRDEGSFSIGLIAAVEEALEIGRQTGIHIHLSHIKCLGVDVWNYSDRIVQMVEDAQLEGIRVTANQYPYEASATGLKAAVVPRWAESGGTDSLYFRYADPELKKKIIEDTRANIRRRGGPSSLLYVKTENEMFLGKTLEEVAVLLNTTPEDAVYQTLKTGYIRVASFNMNPDDIENFMRKSWVVTGSDGNTGHPRKFGSFPRKYDRYVKKEGILSLGEFIQRSSSVTADIFGLSERGRLQEGAKADIIVFDPGRFKDKADYANSAELSEGIIYSLVNGVLVVEKEKYTNKRPGKVLKK